MLHQRKEMWLKWIALRQRTRRSLWRSFALSWRPPHLFWLSLASPSSFGPPISGCGLFSRRCGSATWVISSVLFSSVLPLSSRFTLSTITDAKEENPGLAARAVNYLFLKLTAPFFKLQIFIFNIIFKFFLKVIKAELFHRIFNLIRIKDITYFFKFINRLT